MKVDEAIEIAEASKEAHGGHHIIGALHALAAEVTRLQTHVTKASQRVLEPGFADDLTKFCAGLNVEALPDGVYPHLYMAKEHIKDLERAIAHTQGNVEMAADDGNATELLLIAEQAKVAKLEAQNARYEAKIARWMPIVASSQESDELPDGWTWREPWKFSAEGPDGVVCEPDGSRLWCSDAPRAVMKVVGHRACTVQATIMANQVAKPLAERAYVRDTREGEWPEPMQEILRWTDDQEWLHHHFGGSHKDCWKGDHLWLPAPPPPTDD